MDDLLRQNREGKDLPTEIPATLAARKVAQGGARSLIDVRTPAEVAAEHVQGSVHVPLAQLAARLDEVLAVPAPRMLLCKSGGRATTAQKTLSALGVSGLTVVTGGIDAYRAVGDTVKTGDGMSLERQVRIVAGTLVFVSVLLGLAVHPLFSLVAGFVGAGLVFAGVTDWCGMGMLLAKMPWNTRPAAGPTPEPGGTCAAQAPTGTSGGAATGTCAAQPPPSKA
jgi:rhodanese-related sulfurtransferase